MIGTYRSYLNLSSWSVWFLCCWILVVWRPASQVAPQNPAVTLDGPAGPCAGAAGSSVWEKSVSGRRNIKALFNQRSCNCCSLPRCSCNCCSLGCLCPCCCRGSHCRSGPASGPSRGPCSWAAAPAAAPAVVPLRKAAPLAKHGGKVKIWKKNPAWCVCQVAIGFHAMQQGSRAAGQIGKQNSEWA